MGSGPRADTRLINCYEWTDIHQNYPAKVKKALGTLWGLERPFELGKIILWHGTAGTGKTSALQAFLRSLSDRNFACDYIVDPEDFFDHVGYGYEVLLSSQDENEGRIICLEDAGHLFTSAGRSRPGFSRLLNLTDGLIGQGLKTMFLITTNDPIEKIDPAVRRSGRCIQALEFTELSSDEASIWLERHGIQTEVSEPQTLADLYQLQNAIQNPMDKHFRRQLSPE